MPGSVTKNGKPRTLPLVDMVVERLKAERKESGFVFPVGNYIKAWWSACAKAGLGTRTPGKENGGYGSYEGLIPHDLRRSAVRMMVRVAVEHDRSEGNLRASDGRNLPALRHHEYGRLAQGREQNQRESSARNRSRVKRVKSARAVRQHVRARR